MPLILLPTLCCSLCGFSVCLFAFNYLPIRDKKGKSTEEFCKMEEKPNNSSSTRAQFHRKIRIVPNFNPVGFSCTSLDSLGVGPCLEQARTRVQKTRKYFTGEMLLFDKEMRRKERVRKKNFEQLERRVPEQGFLFLLNRATWDSAFSRKREYTAFVCF